jgi:cob(I)alamin adenosyltransferase
MNEIPKAKIYTRTGDKGKTYLSDGSCVEKFNPRVEAYGCIDELNSHLGFLRSLISRTDVAHSQVDPSIQVIQNTLFTIGSLVACADPKQKLKMPQMSPEMIRNLELEIDRFSVDLPELKHFILPSGNEVGAYLHVCRTSCRQSERRTAEVGDTDPASELCLQYLNRLSDWLFVVSRWINHQTQFTETIWKKP